MVQQGIDSFHHAVEIVPESANTRKLLEDKEQVYRTLVGGGAEGGAPPEGGSSPPSNGPGGTPGR